MIKRLYSVGLLCLLTLSQGVLAVGLGEVSTYLTAASRAGDRLVTVGERGTVLLSDDNGKSWKNVDSGVENTLTEVGFLNDKIGVALGHGSTILKTNDAGETWRTVLQGTQLAELTRNAAKEIGAEKALQEKASALELYALRVEESGASDPLFGMLFLSPETVFVVGAYGMVLRSDDAGENWRVWMAHVDNPQELHLYAILRSGNVVYLAGEQGYLARSLDQGQSFSKLETGHAGSFFTLQANDRGEVLAAGLQGQVILSADRGDTWQTIDSGQTVTLIDGQMDHRGRLLFGDVNGEIQVLDGHSLKPLPQDRAAPLSAFVVDIRGDLLGVGALGIRRVVVGNEVSVSGGRP